MPAELLVDVAARLLEQRLESPTGLPLPERERSPRAVAMAEWAADGARTFERLQPYLMSVGRVDFFGDLPSKHDGELASRSAASLAMRDLLAGSEREIVLQTPYLVMSRPARRAFRALQRRHDTAAGAWCRPIRLAATDAFPVYAMSHKYKRLYLRELGFEIHEFKPFPVSSPIDLAATGALSAAAPGRRARWVRPPATWARPVPAGGAGRCRSRAPACASACTPSRWWSTTASAWSAATISIPRSDDYNTESLVVVHDAGFAQALNASIRADMRPENSWLIAPRAKLPVLSGLNYSLGKLSEKLPIFDLWPFPYATSYELQPDCQPVPFKHPDFTRCYRDVGDFPEVDMGMKSIYTRILTAFGAGLVPIL